jgi:hypothetical protein
MEEIAADIFKAAQHFWRQASWDKDRHLVACGLNIVLGALKLVGYEESEVVEELEESEGEGSG